MIQMIILKSLELVIFTVSIVYLIYSYFKFKEEKNILMELLQLKTYKLKAEKEGFNFLIADLYANTIYATDDIFDYD